MGIVSLILLIIMLLNFLLIFALWVRNNLTYKVRVNILELDYKLYSFLPKYKDMIFSIRPLNTRYWIRYCEKKRDKRKVNEK